MSISAACGEDVSPDLVVVTFLAVSCSSVQVAGGFETTEAGR